ncbi:universal stress protein [Streptomyces sp. NPDC048636]|uniref:universal stress protein n=1 Tax=Streptomyces sp. NPDC048636 TaxID=3155762 RepID=UPI00344518F6
MIALIWITEGTWRSTVDAARAQLPPGGAAGEPEIRLLYVTDDQIAGAAHAAFAGLLGRGHPERDPGDRMEELGRTAAAELLEAAAVRLGRPAVRLHRHGRVEQEVVHAADGADLLICARDGDRDRLGPHSLGHATRFVVDHAPCAVLLVWPAPAPGLDSLPPHPG